MDSRKPLDLTAVSLMLMLCLIWSMQQIALKATAMDFSPVLQIALRSGIGALLVGALMLFRRERLTTAQGIWKTGCMAGFLFALEFLLVGEAVRHTSSGHVVVFLYTAPVFAALGLHWKLPNERLAPLQWIGVALAFAGIAVAFMRGANSDSAVGDVLWGDFLALLGGAAWGATTVVVRTTRAVVTTGDPDAVVSVADGVRVAAADGPAHRPHHLQPLRAGLAQPGFPITAGVLCQLSDLVQSVAPLFGVAAGRIVISDATIWRRIGCLATE